MKIKSLRLRDFRGYPAANFEFGDFNILIGPNGIGKTTILDAVSLLCSSIQFSDEAPSFSRKSSMVVADMAKSRVEKFLEKNIRNVHEENEAAGFEAAAVFEHSGEELHVVLNEKGFSRNDLLPKDWWWAGLTYFCKFDVDTGIFAMRTDKWDLFARTYESITGWAVEPEMHDKNTVGGFYMHKPGGRVSNRKASAGEKKIAKALSQLLNLPDDRQPCIILVDNLEMHAHPLRHLRMFAEFRQIFEGRQVVATTHSTTVIEKYEPRSHLIDVETKIMQGGQ